MTLDLRSPYTLEIFLRAVQTDQLKYPDQCLLYIPGRIQDVSASLPTLYKLAQSAGSHDLYQDLFEGWSIAMVAPLSFVKSSRAAVSFLANGTICIQFKNTEHRLDSENSDIFKNLKSLLQ